MAPVTVVMDTTGYLPGEVAADVGIETVSLYVNFEGGARTVREADLMTRLDTVYEDVRSSHAWPTTSQPSIGDFIACYEPLLSAGRDVVSIHISEGISGTVGAARQAAEQLERDGKGGERVHVLDSASAAGGLGLIGLAAARLARTGAGAEAVVERANAARADLKMWFAIDTLEYLRHSGRIGAAQAWIGSTLKIKPILTLEAEISPVERVRTSKRAFERMVDYARQRHASGADAWVVQHIRSEDEAQRLTEACREVFGCEPAFVSEVGPVLGVHTGPGLLGVGGIPPALLEG
ncbi:MAG: DegV family protein [Thermoleophilaceae bacterium]